MPTSVLVFNGEKARLFSITPHQLKEDLDFFSHRHRLLDNRENFDAMIVQGQPMASFGKQKEKHDLRERDRELFFQYLAQKLEKAAKERGIQHLIIVAPLRLQQLFLKEIPKALKEMVLFEVDVNLVGQKWQDIWKHIRDKIPLPAKKYLPRSLRERIGFCFAMKSFL